MEKLSSKLHTLFMTGTGRAAFFGLLIAIGSYGLGKIDLITLGGAAGAVWAVVSQRDATKRTTEEVKKEIREIK